MSVTADPQPRIASAVPGRFRDPTTLTRWVRGLLFSGAALAIANAAFDFYDLQVLRGLAEQGISSAGAGDAPMGPTELAETAAILSRVVVLILTFILFCMWIHRANANARALGGKDMRFTPGWAVGWYFIPIVSLWKPYQAMKEIYQVSLAPGNWQMQKAGAILPWWWTFWLLSNIDPDIDMSGASPAMQLASKQFLMKVEFLTTAFDVVGAVIAATLVKQIFDLQMAHASGRRAAEVFS